jgi:hypothetical protein
MYDEDSVARAVRLGFSYESGESGLRAWVEQAMAETANRDWPPHGSCIGHTPPDMPGNLAHAGGERPYAKIVPDDDGASFTEAVNHRLKDINIKLDIYKDAHLLMAAARSMDLRTSVTPLDDGGSVVTFAILSKQRGMFFRNTTIYLPSMIHHNEREDAYAYVFPHR